MKIVEHVTLKRCKVETTSGLRNHWRCRRAATGEDGMCTQHRNFFAPRPYLCRGRCEVIHTPDQPEWQIHQA